MKRQVFKHLFYFLLLLFLGWTHLHVRGIDPDCREPVQVLPNLQPKIRETLPKSSAGRAAASHLCRGGRRLPVDDARPETPMHRHQR